MSEGLALAGCRAWCTCCLRPAPGPYPPGRVPRPPSADPVGRAKRARRSEVGLPGRPEAGGGCQRQRPRARHCGLRPPPSEHLLPQADLQGTAGGRHRCQDLVATESGQVAGTAIMHFRSYRRLGATPDCARRSDLARADRPSLRGSVMPQRLRSRLPAGHQTLHLPVGSSVGCLI